MAETMELAVINAANAIDIFTKGGLSSILDGIEAKVRAIPLDGSTAAGRDEIRSTAYKVARTKTALDAEAKKLTEGWRTATGQVNAERKRAQERLDALADEVRAPLTEFENREKVRVAGHQSALAEIAAILSPLHTTAPEIEAALAELAALHIGRQWDEFVDVAKMDRARITAALADRLTARRQFDADQAELARHRKEEAERLVREREERLKAEAAEKARLEAERKAKADADAEARRVIAAAEVEQARVRAEFEKVRAEHGRAQKEAETKAKAERDRLEAEARAIERKRQAEEDARVAAEERAAVAEAARIEAVRKAEADRQAAEAKAAEELKAAQEKAQRDAKAASDAAVAKERERAERQRKAREQARPIEILAALKVVCDGYTYDPGNSDLDDELTIYVRMTLGDYRRASRLRHELEGK